LGGGGGHPRGARTLSRARGGAGAQLSNGDAKATKPCYMHYVTLLFLMYRYSFCTPHDLRVGVWCDLGGLCVCPALLAPPPLRQKLWAAASMGTLGRWGAVPAATYFDRE